MENISNLSSNLPKGEDPLAELNSELSNQFKAAANSVASLYKTSTQRTQLVYKKGYLQCVNDVLEKLKKSPEELEQWLILKKLDLEKSVEYCNGQNDETTELIKIPIDYEFNLNKHHSTNTKFPPCNPIISVERKTRKQGVHSSPFNSYSSPMRLSSNKLNTSNKHQDTTSNNFDSDDEEEHDILLDNSKRKVIEFQLSASDKKPRFTS